MSRLLRRLKGAICQPFWTTVLIFVPFMTSLLNSCAGAPCATPLPPTPVNLPWTYADLRLMDPSDAPTPEQDLLAVYLRQIKSRSESRWEVRLDFLDLPVRNQVDLYLALDFAQSGSDRLPFAVTGSLAWDILIHLPPSAAITALDSRGKTPPDLSLLVTRDPTQASLVVSFDGAALYPLPGSASPPEIALQVFVVSLETNQVVDQTAPARSTDQPPPPANLLLAFDHTFPAYTPAQALRRWDGAHTGPAGGRHGLANLLRLARNRGIPLALLDLKYPPWLSALDYAGGMDQILASLDAGLLLLPNDILALDSAKGISLDDQDFAQNFNIPSSQFGYASLIPESSTRHRLLFLPVSAASPLTTIYRQGQRRILPIPLAAASNPDLQPDRDGLSLSSRRLLVQTALDSASRPASTPILVLGGALTRSSWGIPEVARAAFACIQNHPWIHPLRAYDLLSLPAVAPLPELQPLYPHPPNALTSLPWKTLFSSPHSDPLLTAAWQAALALIPPVPPSAPEFAALQAIYSRQVNILLAARSWARQPQPAATCEMDLDLDAAPECLLASENLYLIFEPDLGALTHAFWLAPDGPHQFIAPSSQFTFGASDPASWDLSADLAADPAVIPGAFYDNAGAFQAQISPNTLTFTDPASGLTKRFSLLPDGVYLEYRSSTPLVVRMPLALDPWLRFAPGWGGLYQGELTDNSWSWGVESGLSVQVRSNGQMQVSEFNDTQEVMGRVEDPNSEYPPGHYLPFPLALGEISTNGDLWLEISLSLK